MRPTHCQACQVLDNDGHPPVNEHSEENCHG